MIGGNTIALLQTMETHQNAIGEMESTWITRKEIRGFLDLISGDSRYQTYDAKIQESTHIFISDYVPLGAEIGDKNARLVVDGKIYDVMLIDNPMGLHRQLEIYLKFVG